MKKIQRFIWLIGQVMKSLFWPFEILWKTLRGLYQIRSLFNLVAQAERIYRQNGGRGKVYSYFRFNTFGVKRVFFEIQPNEPFSIIHPVIAVFNKSPLLIFAEVENDGVSKWRKYHFMANHNNPKAAELPLGLEYFDVWFLFGHEHQTCEFKKIKTVTEEKDVYVIDCGKEAIRV